MNWAWSITAGGFSLCCKVKFLSIDGLFSGALLDNVWRNGTTDLF